jgi:predicted GNAT superfamily acetyltransferase
LSITLRRLESVEDAVHFSQLEALIWSSPPEDNVPIHVTITVIRNGGGLIGAFADDGPAETGGMVGLAFWFPGIGAPGAKASAPDDAPAPDAPGVAPRPSPLAPSLKMCSHMAGVLPRWQGQGVGLALKLAQRAAILEQGATDWVTWTYDPLFRTNAVFNIHRLGAVCNTYRPNWYGVMRDGINAGVPSDRCQVDWWLSSERVVSRLAQRDERRAVDNWPGAQRLPTQWTAGGLPAPVEQALHLDGAPLLTPIPDDIAALRRADAGLGLAWRLAMRETLTAAFAAGYRMVDCVLVAEHGWHYLLEPAA